MSSNSSDTAKSSTSATVMASANKANGGGAGGSNNDIGSGKVIYDADSGPVPISVQSSNQAATGAKKVTSTTVKRVVRKTKEIVPESKGENIVPDKNAKIPVLVNANNIAEEKIEEDPKKKEYKFSDLSREMVNINLRFLSDIKQGQQFIVEFDKHMNSWRLNVENRMLLVGFRRWMDDEGRGKTLSFIHHVIKWAKKYCADDINDINDKEITEDKKKNTIKRLLNTQKLLSGASSGLTKLAATYGDGILDSAIEEYKDDINTFCNQDLEETIAKINKNMYE